MNKIKFISLLFSIMYLSKISLSQSLSQLPLSVAYYGENGIHPGLKIGTYKTISSKEKTKIFRRSGMQTKYGDKTKIKDINLDLNLGFYSHPNNHNGLFINTGLTLLRTKLHKHRFLGLSLELGYLRRDYKFKTYELSSNGTSYSVIKGAGNNTLTIGLAPQFGKEVLFGEKYVRLYIKPLFQLSKYGHSAQPNVNLELGAVFNINRNKM